MPDPRKLITCSYIDLWGTSSDTMVIVGTINPRETQKERRGINNKYFNIKIPLLAGYICT